MRMKGVSGVAVLGVLSLVLTACVNIPRVETPTPSTALVQESQRYYEEQAYRIQRGDTLELRFEYNPELNVILPVRPDGMVFLPIVKEVRALNLTPAELAEQLSEKYASELRKPEVTVIVRTFATQKVFVDAEVAKKGTVSLTPPMTVTEAIIESGGFTEYALKEEVVVIRRPPGQKPKATVVDLIKFFSASDFSQDISLMPYDIVFVPRTHIGDVNTWVEQYIKRMLPFGVPVSY